MSYHFQIEHSLSCDGDLLHKDCHKDIGLVGGKGEMIKFARESGWRIYYLPKEHYDVSERLRSFCPHCKAKAEKQIADA